ncbi:MAG TPA: hypothetical protein VFW05_05155 [Verrucomicrobiae bacterium]|nr:hypothetical protein [Verrucomicrobiae bacterium]
MNLAWLKSETAWQPLTFKGVAAFASAPFRRLLLIQFLFALLTATVVVWCLVHAWFPTVRQTILQMPETGEIRSGQLSWTNETPRLLAEGPFLSVTADPDHSGQIRVPAHFQIEFGRSTVRVLSLLGYRDWPYPGAPWIVKFNRTELEPWWGAWYPPLLWMVFGGVLIGLLVIWPVVATFYFIPVWIAGFLTNRELSLTGSWRLSGAALMPGALVMILSLAVYALGGLDLIGLIAAQLAHWIVGWIYCAGGIFKRPYLQTDAPTKNPFDPNPTRRQKKSDGSPRENPFKARDN